MNKREKLIKDLKGKFVIGEKWHDIDLDELTDFILADRKRIVEPLLTLGKIKWKGKIPILVIASKLEEAREKTIKNAGIEK